MASSLIRVLGGRVWLLPVVAHAGFTAISHMEGGNSPKGLIQELLVGTGQGMKEQLLVVLLVVQVRA